MSVDMSLRDKVPVAVLGATGAVGQRFVELLVDHPWFEIVALAASERSIGKRYGDAVTWMGPSPLPADIANLPLVSCDPHMPCPLVFSALDSGVAGEIEEAFAKAGHAVISNSKNHRMVPHVPLMVPEVNSDHLELIQAQPYGKGMIVTNPNCSVIGLVLSLKPLADAFGLEAAHVVTMQAVSGAGLPGVPSLHILDNVIPHIDGEEAKMESEPLKILGHLRDKSIHHAQIKISAHCNRVPVSDGHTECVSVKLKQKASAEDILNAWQSFTSPIHQMHLPSAPQRPIYYFHESHSPQPKRHRLLDKGMAVSIGRLRPCPLLDFKYTLLSHNTIRGAAGGTLLIAELLVNKGLIHW